MRETPSDYGESLIDGSRGVYAAWSAKFSQEIFDVMVTQVEAVVAPYGVTDDIGRESVAFVYIHRPILSKSVT